LADPYEDPRAIAYSVLGAVHDKGAFADRVLDGQLQRHGELEDRDRGLATELVYGILRRQGTLDDCLRPHLRRPLGRVDPEILRILRIGAYQILFLDRVPDHAAVNESVNLAHRYTKPGTASLVNAVLRSLCRTKDDNAIPCQGRPQGEGPGNAEVDFPDWLVRLWFDDLGPDKARELFRALVVVPPRVLRVNSLKTDRNGLLTSLADQGFRAEPVKDMPGAVRLHEGGDIRRTRCYQEGWCIQQDAASQLVVNLLNPKPGESVLDLCAAPGIKSSHAAQRMANKGLLVAADINLQRLGGLSGLCSRLGVSIASPVCLDAGSREQPCFSGRPFDRVLADAPCSGLGILRRNPERKWRSAPDFKGLRALQDRLLCTAASLLREGGTLVYSTCTVNRQENQGVVEGFLAENPDFVQEDISRFLPGDLQGFCSADGDFRSWNMPSSSDLFFAARFRRVAR